jgi:hypothetical protein
MTTPIVTPVLVFGPDDLLVARSVEAALRHTEQHLKTADPTPEARPTPTPEPALTLDDYEFFDFEGRPLAPVPGGLRRSRRRCTCRTGSGTFCDGLGPRARPRRINALSTANSLRAFWTASSISGP